jgi:hypothetical protein
MGVRPERSVPVFASSESRATRQRTTRFLSVFPPGAGTSRAEATRVACREIAPSAPAPPYLVDSVPFGTPTSEACPINTGDRHVRPEGCFGRSRDSADTGRLSRVAWVTGSRCRSGIECRFFRIESAQVTNSKARSTPQASVRTSSHSNRLRNIQDCNISSAPPKPITAAQRTTRWETDCAERHATNAETANIRAWPGTWSGPLVWNSRFHEGRSDSTATHTNHIYGQTRLHLSRAT